MYIRLSRWASKRDRRHEFTSLKFPFLVMTLNKTLRGSLFSFFFCFLLAFDFFFFFSLYLFAIRYETKLQGKILQRYYLRILFCSASISADCYDDIPNHTHTHKHTHIFFFNDHSWNNIKRFKFTLIYLYSEMYIFIWKNNHDIHVFSFMWFIRYRYIYIFFNNSMDIIT